MPTDARLDERRATASISRLRARADAQQGADRLDLAANGSLHQPSLTASVLAFQLSAGCGEHPEAFQLVHSAGHLECRPVAALDLCLRAGAEQQLDDRTVPADSGHHQRGDWIMVALGVVELVHVDAIVRHFQ
jgi:hypothetical protein